MKRSKYSSFWIIFILLPAFFIISPGLLAQSHPATFINQSEIDAIKARLDAGDEPWKTAFDTIIVKANAALNNENQSVTFQGKTSNQYYTERPYCGWTEVDGQKPDCRDGQHNPHQDRADYIAAQHLRDDVRNLGLAFAFTNQARYAEKAIQMLKTWMVNPDTKMTPVTTNGQSFIELYITIPGAIWGADLIWNYSGFKKADKKAIKQWVLQFAQDVKPQNHTNNFDNWRVVLLGTAGLFTGDNTLKQYAWDRWKYNLERQMNQNGSLKHELTRTNSLSYSLYALSAMVQGAELARHDGVNLYNYKLNDGRSLEKSLDFHAPFAQKPETWPHQQITPYDGSTVYFYELAYHWKPKKTYKKVIDEYGRPMKDKYVMGYATFTHARGAYSWKP